MFNYSPFDFFCFSHVTIKYTCIIQHVLPAVVRWFQICSESADLCSDMFQLWPSCILKTISFNRLMSSCWLGCDLRQAVVSSRLTSQVEDTSLSLAQRLCYKNNCIKTRVSVLFYSKKRILALQKECSKTDSTKSMLLLYGSWKPAKRSVIIYSSQNCITSWNFQSKYVSLNHCHLPLLFGLCESESEIFLPVVAAMMEGISDRNVQAVSRTTLFHVSCF